jgi:hypothetical protein
MQCGESFEVRLKSGGYEVGYSYFGGSMHFEAMQSIPVIGMTVTEGCPDDLDVTIGDRHWHFGIRQPSRQRFIVFQQAFVAGQPVRALNFSHFKVTLYGIQRAGDRLEWDADTIVRPDDFLFLEGPAPALTRAWHYMNDGRI